MTPSLPCPLCGRPLQWSCIGETGRAECNGCGFRGPVRRTGPDMVALVGADGEVVVAPVLDTYEAWYCADGSYSVFPVDGDVENKRVTCLAKTLLATYPAATWEEAKRTSEVVLRLHWEWVTPSPPVAAPQSDAPTVRDALLAAARAEIEATRAEVATLRTRAERADRIEAAATDVSAVLDRLVRYSAIQAQHHGASATARIEVEKAVADLLLYAPALRSALSPTAPTPGKEP